MFYRHVNGGKIIILVVYVNDIILTNNNVIEMKSLKGFCLKRNLGDLSNLLDNKRNFSITTKVYPRPTKGDMLWHKLRYTPIDANHRCGVV